ncbi:hypothetical protein GCM10022267_74070 [Lentzea roselyniae]|uniref:Uncharacterized protein n=1 Tax=Lentzea roselyniae TaxID=531940 RepID=A0ABP7C4Q4_9PSEU
MEPQRRFRRDSAGFGGLAADLAGLRGAERGFGRVWLGLEGASGRFGGVWRGAERRVWRGFGEGLSGGFGGGFGQGAGQRVRPGWRG